MCVPVCSTFLQPIPLDHDQTWHNDGPPSRDSAHHFSRLWSVVKIVAVVKYKYAPTTYTTNPIMTKPGMTVLPRDGALHISIAKHCARHGICGQYWMILQYKEYIFNDYDFNMFCWLEAICLTTVFGGISF